MKEETTDSLHANAVEASVTFESSVPTKPEEVLAQV
jgi:hypothetical protein